MSFAEFRKAAPELAERVKQRLESQVHHILGTIRKDGSPRLSGIEVKLAGGELYWGSKPEARKTQDLLRDGRFALHSGSQDPPQWDSDTKITGIARPASNKEKTEHQNFTLFKAEIREVACIRKTRALSGSQLLTLLANTERDPLTHIQRLTKHLHVAGQLKRNCGIGSSIIQLLAS